jgi:hypothetical protein
MTKGNTCLEITFPVSNDLEGLKNGKVKLEIGTTNRRKNWGFIFWIEKFLLLFIIIILKLKY